MIKIMFNSKRIFLTETYSALQQEFNADNAHILFDCNEQSLMRCIDLLMMSELESVIMVGEVSRTLQFIRQQFTHIVAGGGVVKNSGGSYLLIFRRGKWDLPKGKIDEGENIEECALREVREETGVRNLQIIKPLLTSYHLYFDQVFIFKETCWFLMSGNDSVLRPQLEEGILKAVWTAPSHIRTQLKNTYESVTDLFEVVLAEDK